MQIGVAIVIASAILAAGIAGGAYLGADRYSFSTEGAAIMRYDRLTGRALACAPSQGCLEVIAANPEIRLPKPNAPE